MARQTGERSWSPSSRSSQAPAHGPRRSGETRVRGWSRRYPPHRTATRPSPTRRGLPTAPTPAFRARLRAPAGAPQRTAGHQGTRRRAPIVPVRAALDLSAVKVRIIQRGHRRAPGDPRRCSVRPASAEPDPRRKARPAQLEPPASSGSGHTRCRRSSGRGSPPGWGARCPASGCCHPGQHRRRAAARRAARLSDPGTGSPGAGGVLPSVWVLPPGTTPPPRGGSTGSSAVGRGLRVLGGLRFRSSRGALVLAFDVPRTATVPVWLPSVSTTQPAV